MSYVKTNWVNKPNTATPITADRLNNLETQHDAALAQVAADIADGSSPIGGVLSTTFVRKYPLDARTDYGVSPDRTPTQNGAALQQAVTDAIAQNRALKIDGFRDEPIDIAGTILVPRGSEVHIVGSSERTLMRSTQVGVPVFRLMGRAVIDGFDFGTTAGRSVASIVDDYYRGEGRSAEHSGIKVEYGASGSQLLNLRGSGLHTLITTVAWDGVLNASSAELIQGIHMENIEGTDVAFVILSSGVQDASYTNVRGSYSMTPGTAYPPHLIYMAKDMTFATRFSEGVHLSNLEAWDGEVGAAVKFAGLNGGSITNVVARNCRGVLDVMEASDINLTSILSLQDNASEVDPGPIKASVELLNCNRATVSGVRIDGKAINYHRALSVQGGTSVVVRGFDATVRHTLEATHESKADIDITSPGAVIEDVTVNNLGADRGSGFMLRNFAGIAVRNPSVNGNYKFGVYHESTASGAIIDADQNRLKVKTSLTGSQPFFIGIGSPQVTFRTPASPVVELDKPVAWHGRTRVNANSTAFFFWDSGQPVTKQSGTWETAADGSVWNPANGATDSAVVDAGVADVEIVTRMKFGSSSSASGVVFRALSDSDYLLVALIGSGTVRVLAREAGGATATLAQTAFVPTPGRSYDLKTIAHGNAVEVYVDGVLKLGWTLSPAHQTKFGAATQHGFFGQGASAARWKSLKIRATS